MNRCSDPFPDTSEAIRATLHVLGGELDATRKTVQAEHPGPTLTGLDNVLENVRYAEISALPYGTYVSRKAA